MADRYPYEARLGLLKLIVKDGDITQERTDAIVNCSNPKLDLSKGKVSKALVKAGGPTIQEDCDKQGLQDNVAVTTSGQLPCRRIIHINLQTKTNWRDVIQNALQRAELMKLKSVAFPALGTGSFGKEAKRCAKTMFEAFVKFAKSTNPPTFLREIHVVLFLPTLKADYVETLAQILDITDTTSRSEALDKFRLEFQVETQTFVLNTDAASLNTESKNRIYDLCRGKRVSIKFYESKLRVTGNPKVVRSVIDDASSILREASQAQALQEKATLQFKQVQWKHEVNTGTWSTYSKLDSLAIEMAAEAKQPKVAVGGGADGRWTVEFSVMKEFQGDVQRRVKRTAMGASLLPDNWQATPSGDLYTAVLLDISSDEYKQTEGRIRQWGLQHAIDSIQRIQNETLYQLYSFQKTIMDDANTGRNNEVIAFHGTSKDVIGNICARGFNRSYCGKNAFVWGKGVYFAAAATYSANRRYAVPDENDLSYLFLCRVLVGDFIQGNQSYIEPPFKSDGRTRYDSVVDDVNKPTIYVVFPDARAYPDYLIALRNS